MSGILLLIVIDLLKKNLQGNKYWLNVMHQLTKTQRMTNLITTPYINHPENDLNTPISIVKGDIEKIDQNLFLGNGVVKFFLR